MIKIENTEVFGWEAAIRGSRSPMNSWEKSDSWFVDYWDTLDEYYGVHTIFGRHAEMQDTNEKTADGSQLMDISWFDKDGNPNKVTVPWHDSDDSEVILGFSDHKLHGGEWCMFRWMLQRLYIGGRNLRLIRSEQFPIPAALCIRFMRKNLP